MRKRRKSLWTNLYPTLDDAVNYIKEVKRINKDSVEVEMNELLGGWYVEVWQVKFPE